jgi:hypothetical protein
MQGKEAEIFRNLCERAAAEQNHDKLLELIRQITRMLDTKEDRVRNSRAKNQGAVLNSSASAGRPLSSAE